MGARPHLFFGAVPALGLAPQDVVFSGFRTEALWLILAGFVIGSAIETTGLGARADEGVPFEGDGTHTTFPHRSLEEAGQGPQQHNAWAFGQSRADRAVLELAHAFERETRHGAVRPSLASRSAPE